MALKKFTSTVIDDIEIQLTLPDHYYKIGTNNETQQSKIMINESNNDCIF